MLTKEDFAVIKSLSKRGVYKKDIAEELGVHPKTVSRALKRNQAPEKKRAKRGSKLDPFKKDIDQLLAKNVWNAKVILREIEAEGYTGGYTILRGYIQPKRVLRQGKATVRFETKPGKQLQHDWANIMTMIAGQELKVHFQVNTLGYSRRFHVWCCLREDAEHTYEGLRLGLEYFGGTTDEVLVDNPESDSSRTQQYETQTEIQPALFGHGCPLRLHSQGLPAIPATHQRQDGAHGQLCQRQLLCTLPGI